MNDDVLKGMPNAWSMIVSPKPVTPEDPAAPCGAIDVRASLYRYGVMRDQNFDSTDAAAAWLASEIAAIDAAQPPPEPEPQAETPP